MSTDQSTPSADRIDVADNNTALALPSREFSTQTTLRDRQHDPGQLAPNPPEVRR
jgi:hypothetical protein